ncbi:UDP-glycosyltransferase 87A1-like [Primulina tabacum]|uniref:UDP-glycosyltransferase 87A1-like n=1 Tax=Primulina tabacum TaxID=48773 RepID=UPI003F5936F8
MDSAVDEPQAAAAVLHVVAVPYPGHGHINPMLNLCKAVAEKSSDGIHITFVVTEEWLDLIGSMTKPQNISFAAIPNVVPSERVRGRDVFGFAMAVLTNMGDPFDQLLELLRLRPALIIADAFLPWAADVAGRRNIPVAYLWTMSASVYTLFHHFDLLVQNGHFPLHLSSVNGPSGMVDYIPGLAPSRVEDLPSIIRDQEMASVFLEVWPQESKVKHLIFTSIYHLESQAFDAFKHKVAFSIYNIGPATSFFKAKAATTINSATDPTSDTDACYLKWLDLQSPDSVLYVSLGSYLSVSAVQMDEIIAGLNKSGVRFMLVTRNGLQESCVGNGLVVKWCDQVSVLSHPCVGGFWSHCGWNSTKEAVLTGVPVLAFPIVMDQLLNAKMIVEDWRIGWRVKREEFGNVDCLAKRDDIADLVRRFMDMESPERKELSRNARELRKASEREFADGGLFLSNVEEFTKSILQDR